MIMRARRRGSTRVLRAVGVAGVCWRAVAGLYGRVYALRCSSVDETEQCTRKKMSRKNKRS